MILHEIWLKGCAGQMLPHFGVNVLIFMQFLVKNGQHTPPYGQKAPLPIQKVMDPPLEFVRNGYKYIGNGKG